MPRSYAPSDYPFPVVTIGSIVIRVDDIQRQTAFWSAALDYVPRGPERGDNEGFVLMRPRHGAGPNVSLDRVRSSLQIPPRIHLDLYTDDQAGGRDDSVVRTKNGSAEPASTTRSMTFTMSKKHFQDHR